MNITPVRIYINGNGSISFYGPNNTLITNLQNLNGAKQSNGQIIFDGDDKTISFYVYQLTSIESATFTLPYSSLDSRFFNPSVYSAKLNNVYQDICEYVLVNKNGGASFVGGVVAVYPNYASFPATGQEAVIYIDEGTNQAYFWDGTSYQLLVSTGVQQYANFASFPVTGSANVIYIDMSSLEPYVWDGAAYVSLTDSATVSWGSITGTLSAQTDLQAALDAKFDNPTGTSSEYLDGTGTPTTFPTIPAQYNPTAGTGINITGAYPNQTITNTAPDQIVGLTAGTGIGVTGTYPNFTISNTQSLTGYVPYTGATTNVDLGEYELKAGQFTLDTSPTGTASVGTTQWNNSIGSSETTLKGGSVILKNGVDLVARIVNKVTPNTTLTKAAYQAVRVSGAAGQRLAVEFAQANNDNNSADTIGLVTETIPTNQEGFIMTVGNLEEINTTGSLQGETWADGDVLYLSPTTPGALTNVKPNGSNGHIVVMGYVEYAHAIHGKIYVKIMNGWELDELHNVYINAPTTWQVLRYDATAGYWTNSSLTASILPSGIDAAKIGAGTVDNTEFGYLDGVTSSIQTQLDGKFILPSLTSGSVLFSNGTTIAQNNSNFFWDNTNNRFSVRSAGESSRGISQEDYSTSQGAAAIIFQKARGTFASPLDVNANDLVGACVFNARVGGAFTSNRALFGANMQTSTGMGMYFIAGATNNNYIPDLYIHQSGNVLIGTTQSVLTGITDSGYKLDVNGTAIVQGSFAPTSGSAAYEQSTINVTINQTGGANGITRGLYINPTITSATDFRAIDVVRGKICLNSTSGNTLIGTTTDAGFKLDVNGTARIQNQFTTTGSISAASAIARGTYLNQTLVATANNDVLVGLDIASTFTAGAFTGVESLGARLTIGTGVLKIANRTANAISFHSGSGAISGTNEFLNSDGSNTWIGGNVSTVLRVAGSDKFKVFNTGNVVIQNGGTFTDAGYRLDVNGTTRIQGALTAANTLMVNTTAIHASAIAQFDSGTRGFLPPRMTNAQMLAIASPAAGLVVYDTTNNKHYGYNGTTWNAFF